KQLQRFEAENQSLSEALNRLAAPSAFLEELRRASEHFQQVHDNYVAGFASSLSALTAGSSASTLTAICKTFASALSSLAPLPELGMQMEALNRQFQALARPPLQASILAS